MKKVLIAINNNVFADKVAAAGYELAKALQAEVTLVYVLTHPAYYAGEYSPLLGYQGASVTNTLALVQDLQKEASEFLADIAKRLGDKKIILKTLTGETDNSFLEYSEAAGMNIIVIGSHHQGGLEGLFEANIAGHLLKHSKIPLFIIPNNNM